MSDSRGDSDSTLHRREDTPGRASGDEPPTLSGIRPAFALPDDEPLPDVTTDLGGPAAVAAPTNAVDVNPGGPPPRADAPRPAGTPTFPDYDLLKLIARGGMGVVYKARQLSLNRLVAFKMILGGDLASGEEVQRFKNEAQAAAQLDHPSIVPVFEVGESEGRHYFTMGFVEGQSLDRRVREGPLPAREAARLVRQVAEAVDYAHGRGIVHRDLKPANILLDRDGQPKVTDFGLAKRVAGASDLTQAGQVLGTPNYMPPEQAAGTADRVGPAADVYSLGATLYCLLTGRPPFQSAVPLDTLRQVLFQEPVPPRQLNPAIGRDLDTICLKCLQKESTKRYASAAALAEDLGHYLAGEPIRARPAGAAERLWRWCRRNPAVATLTCGIALSLLTGIVVATRLAMWAMAEAAQARTSEGRTRDALALSERRRYTAEIALAHKDWNEGHVAAATRRLENLRPRLADDPDWRGFEWHYLHRQCRPELATLDGGGPVWAVAFSGDGRRLAAGGGTDGQPGRVAVWEVATGNEVRSWVAHAGRVVAVALNKEGTLLATASGGDGPPGEVKVWDAATGNEVCRLRGSGEPVWAVAFSPDGRRLAWAGGEAGRQARRAPGVVHVWDTGWWESVFTLPGHTAAVRGLAFSPDGRWLASASEDKSVRVWDAGGGTLAATLSEHTDSVMAVAFSADCRLASGGADLRVNVWEPKSWEAPAGSRPAPLRTLETKGRVDGRVESVAFSADGRYLAAGCDDHSIRTWDAATWVEVAAMRGHTGPVRGVAFSPDGWRFASASSDRTVKVWDVTANRDTIPLPGNGKRVSGVAFSPDNRHFATAGSDRVVRVWDSVDCREVKALDGHAGSVQCVAYSPDGRYLASGGTDQTVRVWDLTSDPPAAVVYLCAGDVGGVAFDPDGRLVAAASAAQGGGGEVRVWDVASKRVVRSWAEPPPPNGGGAFRCVAFSPDGRRLAAGCVDMAVKVWDIANGQPVLATAGHAKGPVLSVAFSTVGQRLATAGADGTARLWNLETGGKVATLRGHEAIVWCVAFSPDGQRLATAGADRTVRLWDSVTAQEVFASRVLPVEVQGLAFSPDGRVLVTGGQRRAPADYSVALWDGRDLTPDLLDRQESRSVVTHLFAKRLTKAQVLDRLRRDATLRESVRRQAVNDAEAYQR